MPTDKKLDQFVINKLTAEQYAGIESPDPDQLYLVPDESEEALPPQKAEDAGKALLANGDGTASWKGVANAESANDWKEPQTFSGGAVADEIKSKSTGNYVAKTAKDSSGAWRLSLGSDARPTDVLGTEVSLAGALKAHEGGDVEVGKNLEVDGTFTSVGGAFVVRDGLAPFQWGDIEITAVGPFIEANVATITPGQASPIPSLGFCFAVLDTGEPTITIYIPAKFDESNNVVFTSAGDPDASAYFAKTGWPIVTRTPEFNDDGTIKDYYLDKGLQFGSSDGDHMTAADMISGIGSIAKYQHTVTILAYSSENKSGIKIVFTGYSSKNTPIDSYQDLNEVFGGCTLAASGCVMVGNNAKGAIGIDLHGGTIATDFIMATDGAQSNYKVMLSDLNAPVFTDDVCVPK